MEEEAHQDHQRKAGEVGVQTLVVEEEGVVLHLVAAEVAYKRDQEGGVAVVVEDHSHQEEVEVAVEGEHLLGQVEVKLPERMDLQQSETPGFGSLLPTL